MSRTHFLLPSSPVNFSQSPTWEEICSTFDEEPITTIEELLSIISTFTKISQDDLGYLESFLTQLDETVQQTLFTKTIPFLKKLALQLPSLIEQGSIPRLSQKVVQTLEFTREQVACLLANMFFGTMNKMQWSPYWVNFADVWYKAPTSSTLPNPIKTYMTVLLNYFELVSNDKLDMKEVIKFDRQAFTLPDITAVPLCPVHINTQGKIGDQLEIEIDFANKDIGFGKTGTQEEILFGMSPEMCIAMLFCETMAENESITISGVKKIGTYTGYGNSVQYAGLNEHHQPWRVILAIDAVELDDYEHEREKLSAQLGKPFIRDVTKVMCGFDLACKVKPTDERVMIGTGHWGCGAFGGDKHIKFCQQWIAASLTNGVAGLHYYTFGDADFSNLANQVLNRCAEKKILTFDLWDRLEMYREHVEHADQVSSLFLFLLENL
jgi:poly(ADP-ribose) glycohydrolase